MYIKQPESETLDFMLECCLNKQISITAKNITVNDDFKKESYEKYCEMKQL